MNAPAKNVQRAANESDHGRFPRELHELVERRCHRHSPRHYTVDDFTKNMLKMYPKFTLFILDVRSSSLI